MDISVGNNSTLRHVAKTGDIKDFVITEESGIAKGIRRIVAVTGHEAAEVEGVANELQHELDSIARMVGKGKEAALKQFTVVICNPRRSTLIFAARLRQSGQLFAMQRATSSGHSFVRCQLHRRHCDNMQRSLHETW